MHTYECMGCGKKSEVAFRVNVRNPEKISRASPETPRPLCIRCAEKRRDEVIAEKIEEKKQKQKQAVGKKTPLVKVIKPEEVEVKLKPLPAETTEIRINWRWEAYCPLGHRKSGWTKQKPTEDGDYWIWAEGYEKALFRKITPKITSSVMQPFLEQEGIWYLGPCKSPPTPPEAFIAAKNQNRTDKDPSISTPAIPEDSGEQEEISIQSSPVSLPQ